MTSTTDNKVGKAIDDLDQKGEASIQAMQGKFNKEIAGIFADIATRSGEMSTQDIVNKVVAALKKSGAGDLADKVGDALNDEAIHKFTADADAGKVLPREVPKGTSPEDADYFKDSTQELKDQLKKNNKNIDDVASGINKIVASDDPIRRDINNELSRRNLTDLGNDDIAHGLSDYFSGTGSNLTVIKDEAFGLPGNLNTLDTLIHARENLADAKGFDLLARFRKDKHSLSAGEVLELNRFIKGGGGEGAPSRLSEVASGIGKATAVASLGFGAVSTGLGFYAAAQKARAGDTKGAVVRYTGASLGTAKFIYGSYKLVGSVIAKHVASPVGKAFLNPSTALKAGSTAGKGATAAARFVTGVGAVIGILAGAHSLVKNAIAANTAREEGNTAKAAVLGIQSALDGISIVLDGASFLLDFIPVVGTIISAVLDAVNVGVSIINTVIGFLLPLTQNAEVDFNNFLKSEKFKEQITNLQDDLREKGYDSLEYFSDAKAAGIDADGKRDLRNLRQDFIRELVNTSPDVIKNLAIIDASSYGRVLEGGRGDDLIQAGNGSDILRGGEGNDILDGGPGADILEGGAGNDRLIAEVGLDIRVDGGEGNDTVVADTPKTIAFNEWDPNNKVRWRWNLTIDAPNNRGIVDINGEKSTNYVVSSATSLDVGNGSKGNKGLFSNVFRLFRGWHRDDLAQYRQVSWRFSERLLSKLERLTQGQSAADLPLFREGQTFTASDRQNLFSKHINESGSQASHRQSVQNWVNARRQAGKTVYRLTEDIFSDGSTLLVRIHKNDNEYKGHILINGSILSKISIDDYNDLTAPELLLVFHRILQGTDLRNVENFEGGDQNDVIIGNEKDNRISGGKGADTLDGGAGNDTYDLRRNVVADGYFSPESAGVEVRLEHTNPDGSIKRNADGSAVQTVVRDGVTGKPLLVGNDSIKNFENVIGSAGADRIYGSSGDNVLRGYTKYDRLDGGAGNDVLSGGQDVDWLQGGEGSDTVDFSLDRFDRQIARKVDLNEKVNNGRTNQFGYSNGTLSYSRNAEDTAWVHTQNDDVLYSIENLVGGDKNDVFIGDGNNNRLSGRGGNDVIRGKGGHDVIFGGSGQDDLDGGTGNDTVGLSSESDLGRPASVNVLNIKRNARFASSQSPVRVRVGGREQFRIVQADGSGNHRVIKLIVAERTILIRYTLSGSSNATLLSDPLEQDSKGKTINSPGSVLELHANSNQRVKVHLSRSLDRYVTIRFNSSGDLAQVLLSGTDLETTKIKSQRTVARLENQTAVTTLVRTSNVSVDNAGSAHFVQHSHPETTHHRTEQFRNFENIIGSRHDDELYGTGLGEKLAGGSGNDTLDAGRGNDTLYGDAGNDTLKGGDGDDVLFGGEGDDVLEGGENNDVLIGGKGQDTLRGGEGTDTASYRNFSEAGRLNEGVRIDLDTGRSRIVNGPYEDFLSGIENLEGSRFNDVLLGDNKANVLDGGEGRDHLDGRGGDDTFVVRGYSYTIERAGGPNVAAADTLRGGETLETRGDLADFSQFEPDEGVRVVMNGDQGNVYGAATNRIIANLDGIEMVKGTNKNDRFEGAASKEIFFGGLGEDWLNGGAGHDNLDGGAGNDKIIGGSGNDTIRGGDGDDKIIAGAGNDHIIGGKGVDRIYGGAGVDTVYYNHDTRTSGLYVTLRSWGDKPAASENDQGYNTLFNALDDKGRIKYYGRVGNVYYRTLAEVHAHRFEGSSSFGPTPLVVEEDVLLDVENVYGTAHRDVITGNEANNRLVGLGGDDLLRGGDGNDVLVGDGQDGLTGNDVLEGGRGRDTLVAGGGTDLLKGGEGRDAYVISAASRNSRIIEHDNLNRLAFSKLNQNQVRLRVNTGAGDVEFVHNGHVLVKISLKSLGVSAGQDGQWSEKETRNLAIAFGKRFPAISFADAQLVTSDLATYLIENLNRHTVSDSSDGTRTITGNQLANQLSGSDANDVIDGGAGNDVLRGGAGNNVLKGGLGNDTLIAEAGDNLLEGGAGNDNLVVKRGSLAGTNTLKGGEGTDTASWQQLQQGQKVETAITAAGLTATVKNSDGSVAGTQTLESVENLLGSSGDDVLKHGAGDNLLAGFGGNDTLDGGAGSDRYLVADGHDTVRDTGTDNGTDIVMLHTSKLDKLLVVRNGNDLKIYIDDGKAATLGKLKDSVTLQGWSQNHAGIERIRLSNGNLLTTSDINTLEKLTTLRFGNQAPGSTTELANHRASAPLKFSGSDSSALEADQFLLISKDRLGGSLSLDASSLDSTKLSLVRQGSDLLISHDNKAVGFVAGWFDNNTSIKSLKLEGGRSLHNIALKTATNALNSGGIVAVNPLLDAPTTGNDIFDLQRIGGLVKGGEGHDTYLLNGFRGSNVIEDSSGANILRLTDDPSTLNVSKDGNDLLIRRNSASDSVRVKDFFTAGSHFKLELGQHQRKDFFGSDKGYGSYLTNLVLNGGPDSILAELSDISLATITEYFESQAPELLYTNVSHGGDGTEFKLKRRNITDIQDLTHRYSHPDLKNNANAQKMVVYTLDRTGLAAHFGNEVAYTNADRFRPYVSPYSKYGIKSENWFLQPLGVRGGVLKGTSGDDTFRVSQSLSSLSIRAGAGNDDVKGVERYHNLLDGGTGNDTLKGGNVDDILVGGDGNDVLTGGKGADRLFGGAGDDTYHFGKGDGRDEIRESGGDDTLELDGLSLNQLVFRKSGNDLRVLVLGNEDHDKLGGVADQVTIKDFYNGKTVEHIHVGDRDLQAGDISKLVQATATFLAQNGGDIDAVSVDDKRNDLQNLSVNALS
ncbi:calcium-binding protein [Endozoicomonadaceae bacterium StTr2]